MEAQSNPNGTFQKEEILQFDHERIGNSGDDWYIISTNEPIDFWEGSNRYGFDEQTGFIIESNTAYPFSFPFCEADEDEGIKEQMYPETWEDVLFIMSNFR